MYGLTRRSAVTLLFTALFASACGDAEAPSSIEPPQFSVGSADMQQIARYEAGAPQITIAWAMAWIGPAGGSVRLLDFEIVVPPGAVSSVTRFGIRLPVDPQQSEHAVAEFLPHNVRFREPVTLRLPYHGTTAQDSGTPHVVWWSGSAWEQFTTRVLEDGRIETQTSHFSLYGTEEPSRGITPLGG